MCVLARRYGIFASLVSAIRSGRTYKKITAGLQRGSDPPSRLLSATLAAAVKASTASVLETVRQFGVSETTVRRLRGKLPKQPKPKREPKPKPKPAPPAPLTRHEVIAILNLNAALNPRLPWLSIIRAMPRPTGPAGPLGPREHKQVGPAVRIKPGYLRARDPRAIVCRVYAVGDRPPPAGLGDPI